MFNLCLKNIPQKKTYTKPFRGKFSSSVSLRISAKNQGVANAQSQSSILTFG